MLSLLDRLLTSPGVHYCATRWAPLGLRKRALNAVYRSGEWSQLDKLVAPEIVALVEQYGGDGNLLDLGCGPGTLASAVDRLRIRSYLGVDISSEAIAHARKREDTSTRFEQDDIVHWRTNQRFDLILLTESLYYVKRLARLRLLRRCTEMLRPFGHIVVTVVEPERCPHIFAMIAKHFDVTADIDIGGNQRRAIVFRPRA